MKKHGGKGRTNTNTTTTQSGDNNNSLDISGLSLDDKTETTIAHATKSHEASDPLDFGPARKILEQFVKEDPKRMKYPPGSIPNIVAPKKVPNGHAPKVLCVFLGPSEETAANNPDRADDWNSFISTETGNFTRTLVALDNKLKTVKFSLDMCYLVDAFPLLYWNSSSKPSPQDYIDHYLVGLQYIHTIIKTIQPNFVLSFGKQTCVLVDHVTSGRDLAESPDRLQSMLSDDNNMPYEYARIDTNIDMVMYYCNHPNAYNVHDRFVLPMIAGIEITGGENGYTRAKRVIERIDHIKTEGNKMKAILREWSQKQVTEWISKDKKEFGDDYTSNTLHETLKYATEKVVTATAREINVLIDDPFPSVNDLLKDDNYKLMPDWQGSGIPPSYMLLKVKRDSNDNIIPGTGIVCKYTTLSPDGKIKGYDYKAKKTMTSVLHSEPAARKRLLFRRTSADFS